jgi:hypothetical protein
MAGTPSYLTTEFLSNWGWSVEGGDSGLIAFAPARGQYSYLHGTLQGGKVSLIREIEANHLGDRDAGGFSAEEFKIIAHANLTLLHD